MKRKLPIVADQRTAREVKESSIPDTSSAAGQTPCPSESVKPFTIVRVRLHPEGDLALPEPESLVDKVAVEEPLEIRLVFGTKEQPESTSLSITMRTPGHDLELALGFLVSEGIVQSDTQIEEVKFCGPETRQGGSNIVKVTLSADSDFSLQKVQRHFYTSSSCGICGKASLDAVQLSGLKAVVQRTTIPADLVVQLPDRLRASQDVFEQTGGLHASGLFDVAGNLECLREDVGRHNALDKILGYLLQKDDLQRSGKILVVSGRASFELVQKAIAAGFEIMVAVGAPSSLAIDLAERFGITLIGFANAKRFNIYSHSERVNNADRKVL